MKCKCCPGEYQNTTKDVSIKTRFENMKIVVIDDLHTKQCSICGHQEYPDDSLETIKIIKNHLLKEVEELRQEKTVEKVTPLSKFFKFFSSK
jgi:ribosomal protein L14E/L6E/L27E